MGVVKLLTFVLFSVLSLYSFSEDKLNLGVYIDGKSNDRVGRNLIYHVRQKVAGSKTFHLEEDLKNTDIVVNIVTTEDEKGSSTAYSVVILVDYVFFDANLVGVCGLNKVEICATDIIAAIDSSVSNYKETKKKIDGLMGK